MARDQGVDVDVNDSRVRCPAMRDLVGAGHVRLALAAARVLRGQAGRLVLAAATAAALATGLGGNSGAQAAVPSARTGTGQPSISGLSCEGGSFCLATGYYYYATPVHHYSALAETWDGRKWLI